MDVLFAQAAAFDGQRYLGDQLIVRPRLGDVVLRAALESLAGHVDGTESCDQDDGKIGIAAADFAQEIEAVAIGQADVQEQKIEGLIFEARQARGAGVGWGYVKAFGGKQSFEAFSNLCFIINNEDRTFTHVQPSARPGIPNGKRFPCPESSVPQPCQRAP